MAIDPQSALLLDRQIEVHRELGGLEELEAGLRSQLASGSGALVDAWTRVCLDELKRTPAFVAGALPEELPLPADHRLEDVRWIAQQLGGGMPLRIDSGEARGAMDDRGALPWSHDRFFAPSSVARRAASGVPASLPSAPE